MSKTAKRVILILCCILATVFLVSIIGSVTNGFDDLFNPSEWNAKEINQDNLIKKSLYTISTESHPEGIDVTVNDDGLIRVKGENKTDEDFSLDICTVSLPAGKYTFTSGVAGCSASKYYLIAGTYYADFNNNTFELTTETELTVSMIVKPGEKISTTFSPVIVPGEESGSFYNS